MGPKKSQNSPQIVEKMHKTPFSAQLKLKLYTKKLLISIFIFIFAV